MNTGWWEIDIHGCYSLVKIAFVPICACKNNRRIWRHNASISRSCDVTDQLWWRHNAKSEKAVHGDSCEMSDRWWFLAELCVPGHKIACKKYNNTFITVNNDFWVTRDAICQWFSLHSWLRHSWKSLANRLTRDTKIVIYGNSCIILYFQGPQAKFEGSLHWNTLPIGWSFGPSGKISWGPHWIFRGPGPLPLGPPRTLFLGNESHLQIII